MKRLLFYLLLVPCLCCGAERPSGEGTRKYPGEDAVRLETEPPMPPSPPAVGSAMDRAIQIVELVRGKSTDSKMVEDFIAGFVLKAAQEGNKNAPVDGDLNKQAQFYLLYLDAIHRDMFRIKRQTVAAQKADEEARAALAE